MIAVDTNVLVRFFVEDNVQQSLSVKQLLTDGHHIFVAKTVLLETEWVLRGVYKVEKSKIIAGFEHLGALPQFVFEDAQSVFIALSWVKNSGLDFADALHLATAQTAGAQPFYSFDRALLKRADSDLVVSPEGS